MAVFVFVNLFVAVLLESFENEFDDAAQLDLTVDDIQMFKDIWDDRCLSVMREGLHQPEVRRSCGCISRKVLDELPIRFLESFVKELPVRRPRFLARSVRARVCCLRVCCLVAASADGQRGARAGGGVVACVTHGAG